ncbi:pre-mRNA-processing protein 40C-like [Cornus florida]|uniref:pre-mRNA-processing protein 40C-like n=1 Tax=Cornus florida TaxID=4283 RepID=UPI00289748BD|nr:pre-mRNA-processing protein 40C-like [Cornus florida]
MRGEMTNLTTYIISTLSSKDSIFHFEEVGSDAIWDDSSTSEDVDGGPIQECFIHVKNCAAKESGSMAPLWAPGTSFYVPPGISGAPVTLGPAAPTLPYVPPMDAPSQGPWLHPPQIGGLTRPLRMYHASCGNLWESSGMQTDLPQEIDDLKDDTALNDQLDVMTSNTTETRAVYNYNILTGKSTHEKPSGFDKEVYILRTFVFFLLCI